jgi:hypothetical protein
LGLEAEAPRVTGRDGGASWDLAQYPGMKPSGGQVAATGRIEAAPVSLSDWPYIEEADGSRSQAELEVRWAYDAAGGVGAVRIAPGKVRVAGARTLSVSAKIDDADGGPGQAALLVTLRYVFRHPGEGEQVAVTRLTLFGNGTCTRQGDWESTGQARIAA